MKKLFKLLFSRLFFGGIFILIQIAVMVAALQYFSDRYAQVQTAFMVLSVLAVLYIVNQDGSSAFKIAWILPIVFLPLFGIPLYFLFGKKRIPERKRERYSGMALRYRAAMAPLLTEHPAETLGERDAVLQSAYLEDFAASPASRRRRRSTIPSATSSSPPCSRPSRARRGTYSWSSS